MSKHADLNRTLTKLGMSCRGTGNRMTRRILKDGNLLFEGTAQDTWQWLRDSGLLPYQREPSPRQKLTRAMRDSDRWVCRIVYLDRDGKFTQRTISPIRYTAEDRCVMALCIGRQDHRQFTIARIKSIAMVNAATVLMGEDQVQEVNN